jgi:hypothetical protein
VTWRGRIDLDHEREHGRVLVDLEAPNEQLTWSDVLARATAGGQPDGRAPGSGSEHTAVGIVPPKARALPFTGGGPGLPPAAPLQSIPHGSETGHTRTMRAISPADQSPAWLQPSPSQPPPPPLGEAYAAPPPGPKPRPDDLMLTLASGTMSPWASAPPPQPSTEPVAPPPPPPAAPAPPPAPPVAAPPPIVPAMPVASPLGPMVRPPNPVEEQRPPAVAAAPPPPPVTAPRESAPMRAASERHEVIELLWLSQPDAARVAEWPAWVEIVAELRAEQRKRAASFDFDEQPPEEPSEQERARRELVAVMTRGHMTQGVGLGQTMLEAVDASGSFAPPLVLMSGVVAFPFDELETLKATVTAVTPLVAGNKPLEETIATVNELLKTPWLQGSGEVATGLTEKVRKAFKQGERVLDPSYLDTHTERILLEQRCYQRRTVFGETWIRAQLTPPMSKVAIPTYLPEALAKTLPMFTSFPARVLAEAHVQQDQYEAHDCALKAIALGRVVRFGKR